MIDRLTVLFLKFLEYFHKLQVFVWWLLELHIIKIVSSYIIWVTVKEASKTCADKISSFYWCFLAPQQTLGPNLVPTYFLGAVLTAVPWSSWALQMLLPNQTLKSHLKLKSSVGNGDPSHTANLQSSPPMKILRFLFNFLGAKVIVALSFSIPPAAPSDERENSDVPRK